MRGRAAALAAALLFVDTTSAHAHTVVEGIGGFQGGLLHPLLVPAHALTLIALGLLATTLSARLRAALIVIFVAAIAIAFALVAMAFSASNAELIVLGLGGVTGLLLASGWRGLFVIDAGLAAAIGVAMMFDSVPAVLSIQETVLSLAGTALAATAIVAVTAWLPAALPQHLRPLGVRIAGSWIAASAIMVMALRLS